MDYRVKIRARVTILGLRPLQTAWVRRSPELDELLDAGFIELDTTGSIWEIPDAN